MLPSERRVPALVEREGRVADEEALALPAQPVEGALAHHKGIVWPSVTGTQDCPREQRVLCPTL
jgi:hypothetical protein